MNAFINTLRSLGPLRLATMAAVAGAVVAFFIYLTSRLTTPDMALLYGDLDVQDSGQIVSQLEQMNVPFNLRMNGTEVQVPRDQVGRLRVAMAEAGLPSGGSIGYEIFDRSDGLGTTTFVQNINHLRALEGELARTIKSMAQVGQARVHLVLPQRQLFSRERQEPSASIVVTMRGGQRPNRDQVLAIQHLVAAAVPGLKPNHISIVDSKGTLLARGGEENDAQTLATNAEELRQSYEYRLARTIEELIERSVGIGNVRAEVTADMDFDRITENAEIYDPDSQVVRSTQVIEETSDSQDSEGEDPVSVGINLPDAGLPGLGDETGNSSRSARTEETVNYEITRTVKTHVRETGSVRRLSVAVLVNDRYVEGPDGEMLREARPEAELAQLAALVRSAVGFDEARGDTIEIVNMRFADLEDQFDTGSAIDFFGITQQDIIRVAELLVLGLVAILVLLLVVRPLVVRMLEFVPANLGDPDEASGLLPDPSGQRPALAGPELPSGPGTALAHDGGGALTPDLADPSTADLEQMIDIGKVEGRVRASSLRKMGEIVDKHPEETVAIVRNWLYQEG